ncbi:MAG: hydrogenase [Anaerolineales bacterium]|nr:hydrogenase [Anaerolineales bacterium]
MILLIGYGNDLRRDDGAGLILAERLERVWRNQGVAAKLLPVHQLTPELAAEIAEPDISTVVFVDARVIAPDEVDPQVQVQSLNREPLTPSLGHYLDPATLLLYADRLYGRRPAAWLVTVPAADFGYDESLSQITRQALVSAHALPAELLVRLQIPNVMEIGL